MVALLAAKATDRIKRSARIKRVIEKISGCLFIGLGVRLAFERVDEREVRPEGERRGPHPGE